MKRSVNKKSSGGGEGISYWESMADGVVGLLLYVLLIVMLLILLLLRTTSEDYIDTVQGDNVTDFDDYDNAGDFEKREDDELGDEEEEEEEEYDEEGDQEDNTTGGGGKGEFDDPDPGAGEGEGSDRAAVLVQVVDGETRRTIKKAGVEFELYNGSEALQILNTYYPVKTAYKKYETDKNGVFYLPEKIKLGSYFLHGLSSIEGYDVADNKSFLIDKSYEWEEPYTLQVEVFPSRNVIRIQLSDAGTGNGLRGASFNVVAASDIVTKDGTTRLKQGEIADTIVVGDNGYGESQELFIGKYLLRQDEVPEYYGAILTDTPAEVDSKSNTATPPVVDLKAQKTTMRMTVTDALYENIPIAGAVFEVTGGNGELVSTLRTDDNGRAVLTDLKKGITYQIHQVSTVEPYIADTKDHEFTVSARGLIEDNVTGNIQLKNRVVRASFTVRDKIFRGPVSDINIAVLDSNGKVVKKWETTATESILTGLKPGRYRVIVAGNEGNTQIVNVEDLTDIQEFSFDKWTLADTGAVLVAVLLVIGLIVSIVFAVLRVGEKKRQKGQEGGL